MQIIMIALKELLCIVIALIIVSFCQVFSDLKAFPSVLLMLAIVFFVYIVSKKLMASYLDSEEETKIWMFERYGLYESSHLKTPIPLGILAPIVVSVLTLGYVNWFAIFESDIKSTSARASKRHDFYSFSELTEWHIGLIPAAGIVGCFFLSVLAYFFNYPELAKLSMFFAAFNLIPLGKLDGAKIFFASRNAILWIVLVILTLVGLFYASPLFY